MLSTILEGDVLTATAMDKMYLLTLSRRRKTSIILLWLTSDDLIRQGESSRRKVLKG